MFRALGDTWGIATALVHLAHHVFAQGDLARTIALAEESLALFEDLHDTENMIYARLALVNVALVQGDTARAACLNDADVALIREIGDHIALLFNLHAHGQIALAQCDADRARGVFDEILGLAREAGLPVPMAMALQSLGAVALMQGDAERAAVLLRQSLQLYQALEDRSGMAACFEHLAQAACLQGQRERSSAHYEWATQLIGAAEALRAATGHPMFHVQRTQYERAVATTRAALGVARWTEVAAAGGAMPLPELVTAALVEPRPPAERGAGQDDTAQAPRFGRLTRREREVLHLVAQGLGTAAVAAHLQLSPRTVNVHLRAIYRKLHVTSRTAAARVAHDLKLL
jgi:DNA-binding CsgD family transcriptional regulator